MKLIKKTKTKLIPFSLLILSSLFFSGCFCTAEPEFSIVDGVVYEFGNVERILNKDHKEAMTLLKNHIRKENTPEWLEVEAAQKDMLHTIRKQEYIIRTKK